MKTKLLCLTALFLVSLMFMNSCKKEKSPQPRYPDYVFFKQGSNYLIDKAFPRADKERAVAQPMGYEELTDTLYAGFVTEWDSSILEELDKFTGKVNKSFRYGPPHWYQSEDKWTAKKAYNKENAGFDPRFFEVCPKALTVLHSKIRDYVLGVVDGSPEWTDGTANQEKRQEFLNFLNQVDEENEWSMTYGQQFRAAIHDYVVTGKLPTQHSKGRNGWFLFRAEKW